MMEKKKTNEVIIIGGDHHNTLAIVRCFGKKKISFITLIHGSNITKKDLMISHSKYIGDVFIVENSEDDIKKWLFNNIKDNKQVIIPCSDLSEYTIDNNYKELSPYYEIPGFKDKAGHVCKLMDKFEQSKWALKNGIKMARSWLMDLKNNKYKVSDDIIFPCIIKPNVSAFGSKSDIKICNNKKEMVSAIKKFREDKYKDVIIQDFLTKEYEVCAVGCIINNGECYGGIIKKIRENPPRGGGSLTFAKFFDDKKIQEKVNIVLKKLSDYGYNGLYDIEFLVCKDDIYLNEINFRHSGNGYALIKSGIEAPYIWYLSKKEMINPEKFIKKNKQIYFIDDFNEASLFMNKEIGLGTLIHDFFKAKAHSTFSLSDLKVFMFLIKKSVRSKLKK